MNFTEIRLVYKSINLFARSGVSVVPDRTGDDLGHQKASEAEGSRTQLTSGPDMTPTSISKRIAEIDIVRALALFGIVLVNFSSPTLGGFTHADGAGADHLVFTGIETLFEGKVYPLFSLLFGLGMAIQMQRAQSRGARFSLFFLRRLGVLYVIGLTHAFLLWSGDILHIYAMYGFILLLFVNRSNKTLLIAAALFIAAPALYKPVMSILGLLGQSEASSAIQGIQFYTAKSYWDFVNARAQVFVQNQIDLTLFIRQLDILGMFLLGFYAGRRGVLQNVADNIGFIRKMMWTALVIGGAGLGWGFVLRRLAILTPGDADWLQEVFSFLESPIITLITKLYYRPALAIFYGCALILLLHHRFWLKLLRPFASAGRMALSNYLMQSLVATILFYEFGLALYGKIGFAKGESLAAIVYILQIPLSIWWLNHFRFGPMEWAWRSLTYGKLQPFRIKSFSMKELPARTLKKESLKGN